jgi:hypothetical protein
MSRRKNNSYSGAHTTIGPGDKDWFGPPRPAKPKRSRRYVLAYKQFQETAEKAYEKTKGRGRLIARTKGEMEQ